MTDMVPELMEKIQKEFDKKVKASKKIKPFESKLKAGKATAEDVSEYASDIGDIAGAVLAESLTEDVLPGGRMYYNIGNRTVKPILQQIFDMVMDAAKMQQASEDKKSGIGMKAVNADFPEEKINDLIFKFSEIFDKETNEQSI